MRVIVDEKELSKIDSRARVERDEQTYEQARQEYKQLTETILALQRDLNRTQGQLNSLEMLQTFKTSSEVIEQFYDEEKTPSSIKLSPSLQRKLAQKKERMAQSLSTSAFSRPKRNTSRELNNSF